MKFECEKSLLAAAIEGVSRAISNRTAIPVLEGIYVQAEGSNLTLTGYDMEMGLTATIDCNVQAPGEAVLDAKLLGSMVSRMPAGDVGIELNEEGMAIIRGGVAEFEIPGGIFEENAKQSRIFSRKGVTKFRDLRKRLPARRKLLTAPLPLAANRKGLQYSLRRFTIPSWQRQGSALPAVTKSPLKKAIS